MVKLQQLMEEGMQSGATTLAWEKMQQVLEDAKLAWYAHAIPEFVGISTSNRRITAHVCMHCESFCGAAAPAARHVYVELLHHM